MENRRRRRRRHGLIEAACNLFRIELVNAHKWTFNAMIYSVSIDPRSKLEENEK